MAYEDESIDGVESLDEFKKDKKGQARRWHIEIGLAQKEVKQWHTRGRKILKRYRDEKSIDVYAKQRNKYNVLWSNVQTLQPALYSKTPKPQVERRFKDSDPVGRAAAQVLERATSFAVQSESFDPVMKKCRDEWLLVGRGVAWTRYEPSFGEQRDKVYLEGDLLTNAVTPGEAMASGNYNTPGEQEVQYDEQGAYQLGEPYQVVEHEEVHIDHVNWQDFFYSPARCWEEVRWVAKRVYMSQDELKERFGEAAEDVPLSFSSKSVQKEVEDAALVENEMFKKATVYEIWDKPSKKVCWVAEGHPDLLDAKPDPLRLHDFFPCPRPLSATTTSDTMIPVPDYALYQDQATELDNLTGRLDRLIDSVRVAGVYDARYTDDGLGRMLKEKADNELIPVSDWPGLQDAGGLDGVMDFLDIRPMVDGIKQLYQAREITKNDLYEITGMSDIIRGYSAPHETATAQEIKGQFASLRLQDRQSEVQRFAKDCIALMAEIIAEHFSPETLAQMSGFSTIDDPAAQQNFMAAVQLLKDDSQRTFRVDIETDSTVSLDRREEKQSRVEFIQAMGQFVERAFPIIDARPELAPALLESLTFFVRGFKSGRNLESSLEQATEEIKQSLAQKAQQPEPPSPEQLKAQQQQEAAQQKMQLDMAELQQKAQVDRQELELKLQEITAKHELEREKLAGELAIEREKLRADLAVEEAKLAQKEQIEMIKQAATEQPAPASPELGPINITLEKPGRQVATFTTAENGDRVATIEPVDTNG